jgi:signal transduction histidine kinase
MAMSQGTSWIRSGVRTRIGLAFSALGLALFGAIGALSGLEARQQSEREASAALQQVADRLAQRLDADMAARFRDVKQLAQLDALLDLSWSPEGWRRVLEALQSSAPHYSWIGVANEKGQVQAGIRQLLEGRDVSQRPWFIQGLSRAMVGDVHEAKLLASILPAPSGGEPLRFVDVAAPLTRHGKVVGVVGAHLSWQWAEERRKEALKAVARDEGVDIVLVDRQGKIELGAPEPALPLVQGRGLESLMQAPRLLQWPDGERYLTALSASKPWADYPGMGWVVVARQSEAKALAGALALQKRLWWLGLLGALSFGLCGWVLADRLTRPLRRVAQHAQTLMPARDAQVLPDEVEQLANSLAVLLDGLKHREDELRTLNETLETRVKDRTAMLEQVNEDLRSFSRSVSHDLRGPLGVVGTLLRQMMERERASLSPKCKQTIDAVIQECERLGVLTKELLTLAMVEDRLLQTQTVDHQAMVRDVIEQLTATLQPTQVPVFEVGILPPSPGDPVLIRQVWTNLLSNAMKFSSLAMQPRITVHAMSTAHETVFEVADNGVGFDPSQASRLFGVFQRLHGPSRFPGSGVGLSIVRRVVHRHEGRVWASSAEGQGAHFHFALPHAPPSAVDAGEQARADAVAGVKAAS